MPIKLRRSINLSTPMPQTVVAYGARLLNRRTIGRTTQDPCAEDFHWLSPYTVCGSDPINYVDLDGKKITTIIGNLIYEYINGDDGWGFYKNGKKYEGSNNFVTALLEALAKLQSAPVGSALVESIVDSEKSVNIKKGKINCWVPHEMTVYFNTTDKSYSVVIYNSEHWFDENKLFVSLSHELFHAESALYGYIYKEWGKIGNESYCTDEMWAVYGENYIRYEHGLDIRIGYGIINGEVKVYPYQTKEIMFPFHKVNSIFFSKPELCVCLLNYRKRNRK